MLSPCKDRRLPLPEMRKCLERGGKKEMNEHFVGLTIKKIDIKKNPISGKIGKDMLLHKNEIYVDLAYQRTRSPTGVVRSIATNLSWDLFGKLIIADMGSDYPKGRYAIVDGGGRHLATLMREDVSKVPCLIYPCDSVEEAAHMFYYLNTIRKNPTTVEKHISALAFRDPISCQVQNILTKHGIEVTKSQKPMGIQAIRKCKEYYIADPVSFEKSIEILSVIGKECPIYQDLIQGVTYLIRFCDADTEQRFISLRKRIIKSGGKQLHGKAAELAVMNLKGDRMIAEGMLGIINKALHADQRFELKQAPANRQKQPS